VGQKRVRAQQFVLAYLVEHPCVDCENSDIRVLDFDHVRGEKRKGVSKMINQGFPTNTIAAEIEKCEVRCANCHRIVTAERGGFWRAMGVNNVI
jgi:hypothetical protein